MNLHVGRAKCGALNNERHDEVTVRTRLSTLLTVIGTGNRSSNDLTLKQTHSPARHWLT
jgi:hypothetical protein